MAGIKWLGEEETPDRVAAAPAAAQARPTAPTVAASSAAPPAPAGPSLIERGTGVLSQIDAAVRGAADTLTMGGMDELSAYLGSLTGIGGKRGDYSGNLAQQRAVDTFDADAMPIARGTGQVAGGVTAALALPSLAAKYGGASILPRVMAGAAEGAAYGGAYGFGSGEGGAANRLNLAATEAPKGAVFGGAASAAAPYVARGVDRLFGRSAVDPLVEARQAIAATLGVDPAQVPAEMAQRWAGRATQAADGTAPATARAIAADEFGIPLTRGQATGDVAQQAFEEAARNEGRGLAAGRVMRGFDDTQRSAIESSAERLAREAAGTTEELATRNPLVLSEQVLNDLRAAEGASRQGINQAYDAARNAGAAVKVEALGTAPTAIRRHLDDARVIVNDTLTPYTSRALSELDEFSRLGGALENRTATLPGGADDRIAGVSLDGIEKQRGQLVAARRQAETDTDRRALGYLIRGFDDWLDDAGSNGLLTGTPEGLELFKAARATRRTHGELFESSMQQADDDAGKIIEKMIDKDVQPVEVANALFGATRVGEKGSSVRLAKRLKTILGSDSPEFGAVKQAAWEKVIRNDKGELLGPQAMASAVQRFASQGGEGFARNLFTPEEIGRMRRYSGALRSTVADPAATNPSKTGYAIQRLVQDTLGAGGIGIAALGTGASPALALGAALAAGGARTGVHGARAVQATRGVGGPGTAPARPMERAVTGIGRGATAARQDEGEPLTITVRPNRRTE